MIITATAGLDALEANLASLVSGCETIGAELIVLRAGEVDELSDLARRYPSAAFMVAAPGTRTSDLRRAGLLHSSRNIIAFVDDGMPHRRDWTALLCHGWHDWVAKGGRIRTGEHAAVCASARPVLSVVMPVSDGGESIARAMDAIARSELPRESWELVVVDDASDDDTALLAVEHADRLVRLPGRPHGPGYARNRGFEVTLGECVAFVNADVMVQPDTLRRAVAVLTERPEVDAVFGTYDTRPAAKEFVSQYRNLLQHYYHRANTGYASTFSSACGTIRSAVFEEAGGYDEWHFARHQLEDLELGQRLRHLGHRIVLHPDIHSTHLKRWTLPKMIATEIIDHGVPWMRLRNRPLMPAQMAPRTMRVIKRRNVALTWLGGALAVVAWREGRSEFVFGALVCLALLLVNNRAQLAFFRHERGRAFALATIPLDIVYYFVCGLGTVVGWFARQALGDPRPGPAAEAFFEMSVKRWPPAPVKRDFDHYDLSEGEVPPSAP